MGKSLTDEEFNRRVNKDTQGDYTFLEPYIGRHNKILCRHNSCGYGWKVEPGAFLGNKNKTQTAVSSELDLKLSLVV